MKPVDAGEQYIRAAHWILHVLRPGCPIQRDLHQWIMAAKLEGQGPSIRQVVHPSRSSNPLSRRFANYMSTVLYPSVEEEASLARSEPIAGVTLQNAMVGFMRSRNIPCPSDYSFVVALSTWQRLLDHGGNEGRAHAILLEHVCSYEFEPDLADTSRKIRAAVAQQMRKKPECGLR